MLSLDKIVASAIPVEAHREPAQKAGLEMMRLLAFGWEYHHNDRLDHSGEAYRVAPGVVLVVFTKVKEVGVPRQISEETATEVDVETEEVSVHLISEAAFDKEAFEATGWLPSFEGGLSWTPQKKAA